MEVKESEIIFQSKLILNGNLGKCNPKTKECECNNGEYPNCKKLKCNSQICRPSEKCEEIGNTIICSCPNGQNPRTGFCNSECKPFACGNFEICMQTR